MPRYADGQMPFFDAVKVAVEEGKKMSKETQAPARNGDVPVKVSALPALQNQQNASHTPAPAL